MRKMVRILALALVMAVLTGCGKSFACRDLTMSVPSGLEDVSGQNDFSDYTFALYSDQLAIFGLQESYAEIPVLKDISREQYAELVIKSNDLSCSAETRPDKDYVYFAYTYEAEQTRYKYLTGVYQSEEGFWMIQIVVPLEKYDEGACFAYLDSVEFK